MLGGRGNKIAIQPIPIFLLGNKLFDSYGYHMYAKYLLNLRCLYVKMPILPSMCTKQFEMLSLYIYMPLHFEFILFQY